MVVDFVVSDVIFMSVLKFIYIISLRVLFSTFTLGLMPVLSFLASSPSPVQHRTLPFFEILPQHLVNMN